MKETMQVHTSMLQNLIKKVSGVVTEAATLPEGLKFPLETVDQLEEMETHLIDPGVRTGLVNVLSEIGGRNIDECVKRVMKFIISDTLATKMNMSGMNNKKAFGPTNLFEAVYRGVKRHSQTSDCTRRSVEHAVAKWLIGGRNRSGNRIRRATGATLSAN
ncbi:uncharacterized protein [Macrobrachium rosenbergii]|uniref:uncharacterized protein n=1 Tax=Macrobrachium rosenbergii TaxID=79674 RepID=UPI0034D5ED26